MKFHYHVLINQAAGGGNGKKASQKIIQLLNKNNFSYTTYFTEYPNHELELVEELAEDVLIPWEDENTDTYPLLLVIGGDGTLHQIVSQLKKMQKELPIAYIPAGSGNDFARGVGLSREPEKAFWQMFKTQKPQAINILTYNEQVSEQKGISVNNIGIGLDAAIVNRVNQSVTKEKLSKFNLGSLSYIATLLSVLFKQKGFPILVEANGKKFDYDKAFLCTANNHPYFGGGVAIAPSANIAQKKMNFIVVERIPLYKILWLILLLLQKKQEKSKYFHQIETNKLRIVSTTAQFAQTDGEELGDSAYDIVYAMDQQLFWL